MEIFQITKQISFILTELEARESSNNSFDCLQGFSRDDLCKMGIDLFEQLRHTEEKEKER